MNEPPPVESGRKDSLSAAITLDVREDLRQGREPFAKIMDATSRLAGSQELRLIVPFEPVPLFHVLGRMGFKHVSQQTEDGDWEILFSRGAAMKEVACPEKASVNPSSSAVTAGSGGPVEVDTRGLEPPQPLVTILEALSSLPGGVELRARTDRRPIHLYARLEERGFSGETTEENGSFVTHIRRR